MSGFYDIHVLTHSGLIMPFPDTASPQTTFERQVNNDTYSYKIKKYEYIFNLDKENYENILKKFSFQSKNFILMLFKNFYFGDSQPLTLPHTWGDLIFFESEEDDDERREEPFCFPPEPW